MRITIAVVLAACSGNAAAPVTPPRPPPVTPKPPLITRPAPAGPPALPVPSYAFEAPPPRDKIVSLSGDRRSTCIVRESGAVDCWGFITEPKPQRLTAITDATAVHVDMAGACFLTKANTVRCLRGDDVIAVPELKTAIELADGDTSCARISGGKLACWGSDSDGKPQRAKVVPNLADVVAATTDELDCAITSAGKLWCDNGTGFQAMPLANVRAIAFGDGGGYDRDVYVNTCAIVGGGGVKCFQLAWTQGRAKLELGAAKDLPVTGATALRYDGSLLAVLAGGKVTMFDAEHGYTATPVPVLADAVALTPRCALRAQGSVVCWGDNEHGVLGLPYTTRSATPVPVVGIADVTAITSTATGVWAVTGDGSLYHWGDGNAVPEKLAAPPFTSLAAHPKATRAPCGLARGGGVACIDFESYQSQRWPPPVQAIALPAAAVELTATRGDHLARLANGSYVRWGGERTAPAPVPNVANAAQVVGESRFSCARHSAARVTCQQHVCTRDTTPSADLHCTDGAPVPITVDHVAELAITRREVCARRQDGDVVCWPANSDPTLGRVVSQYPVPQPIAGVTEVVALRSTDDGFCAARRDGRLTCWGDRKTKPTDELPAGTLQQGVTFTGYWGAGCLIDGDRRPRCWGENSGGMLGDGSVIRRDSPVAVPAL